MCQIQMKKACENLNKFLFIAYLVVLASYDEKIMSA